MNTGGMVPLTRGILDALPCYLLQLRGDGRSHHTLAQAERHIRQLARYLPEHKINEVEPADVARFLAWATSTLTVDGRYKKPSTLNALRSSVRVFFGYMHAAGYIGANPARLLRRARTWPAPPRGLTAPERERLLKVLAGASGPEGFRDRVLFETLLGTGVRIGSALALNVRDVDLHQGVLHVLVGKGNAPQKVFMPRSVAQSLRELIGDRRSGPLFLGARGRRIGARQVQRRLEGWVKQANLFRRVSPHALRHSFAIDLYERTGDVLLVQAALGHRSIMSTVVYAQAASERVARAIREER